MRNWFAVQTKPRQEEVALRAVLGIPGMEAFLPVLGPVRGWKGQRSPKAFFPCYLFVRPYHPVADLWAVNRSFGVVRVLNCCGYPSPVDDEVVAAIRIRLDRRTWAPTDKARCWSHGEKVRLHAGLLRGYDAVFDRSLPGRERARVLVKLINRVVPAELPNAYLLSEEG